VLEEALPAMKAEYDDVESYEVPSGLTIADSRGMEANFYCLDLLITSRLVAFTVKPYTYLLQMQAEDRTFEKLDLVFQAMQTSILRSLKIETIAPM
jgi:hypothetical protein